MINRITYSVEFPTNGLKLEGEFKPQPGITAVIGPNESGKTFTTIELTRYLLFGKRALRGPASDYKKLEVEGDFTIRGHRYIIKRTAKKETLTDAVGAVLATGSEEVTNKVAELLGYGLLVFDITNASVQKQADLFGTLKPAERKQLIDQVVGLAAQEKVEKELRSEATALQREAEALTRQLHAPVKPERPSDYLASHMLENERNEMRTLFNKANEIAAQIGTATMPTKPEVERPDPATIEALRKHQDQYRDVERERKRLADVLADDVEPQYTETQLEAAAQRLVLRETLANQVTCPKCGADFVPGHDHVDLPDGPDLETAKIRQEYRLIEQQKRRVEAQALSEKLLQISDKSVDLKALEQAREDWGIYDRLVAQADEQEERNEVARKELEALGDIPSQEDIEYVSNRWTEARVYEQQVETYERLKEAFDKLSADIAETTRRAKAFKDGYGELAAARASIKGYLAPAISAAASNLLHHMTKGKHSVMTVNEDMEITVGNQSLDTLSGGAATVANLALRFALGQVLVAETFPVFLGDEMDSDADDGRRETVADALKSLVDRDLLKQVVLITHRGVDIADHVLSLGDTEL